LLEIDIEHFLVIPLFDQNRRLPRGRAESSIVEARVVSTAIA
jgi:hypothetical protein